MLTLAQRAAFGLVLSAVLAGGAQAQGFDIGAASRWNSLADRVPAFAPGGQSIANPAADDYPLPPARQQIARPTVTPRAPVIIADTPRPRVSQAQPDFSRDARGCASGRCPHLNMLGVQY